MNIYVGNLERKITEDELQTAFAAYGEVTSVKIIKDMESGESKGFGFVEMTNSSEGHEAITGLNEKEMNGRALRVSEARPKTNGNRPDRRRGPGGHSGSGGYGNQNRGNSSSSGSGNSSSSNRYGGNRGGYR